MRRVSTRVLPDPGPGDDQERAAPVLHCGPLGQGEVVDQRRRPPRERTGRGGRAPARARARAPSVVVGLETLGPSRRLGTGFLVGQVEEARMLAAPRRHGHSHSMVPGGFDVTSRATRFTPSTSLMMREAIRSTRS